MDCWSDIQITICPYLLLLVEMWKEVSNCTSGSNAQTVCSDKLTLVPKSPLNAKWALSDFISFSVLKMSGGAGSIGPTVRSLQFAQLLMQVGRSFFFRLLRG